MSVEHKSNKGGVKGLFSKLKKLNDYAVFVGIPKSDNPKVDGGLNLSTIASINELGTADIPSRPFVRQTLSENADKYKDMYRKGVLKGDDPDLLLKKIAKVAQVDVQVNIRNGDWKANSQATINKKSRTNRKGGNGEVKPLIDTGRLQQSIKGVVLKGDEE